MTDDLRTRIADCCGVTSVDLSDSDWYAVADAVIRELGWRQEFSVKYTPEGCTPPLTKLYEWSCGHERITERRDQAEFDAKSFYENEPEELPNVVSRYVTEWTVS